MGGTGEHKCVKFFFFRSHAPSVHPSVRSDHHSSSMSSRDVVPMIARLNVGSCVRHEKKSGTAVGDNSIGIDTAFDDFTVHFRGARAATLLHQKVYFPGAVFLLVVSLCVSK